MYLLIVSIFLSIVLIYGDLNICKNPSYQANTLKTVRNQVVAYSFVDASGYSKLGSDATVPNRFEPSDIVIRPDGRYMYVVLDNTYQIGAFCTPSALEKNDCTDQLLDWPDKSVRGLNSDFEGLTYNPLRDTYYIAQEVIPTAENPEVFKPIIFEIRITNTKKPRIKILNSCVANVSYTSRSKGFEGLEFVTHQQTGKSYLLALCEANLCASELLPVREDNNLGNGRLVVLELKAASSSQPCYWHPIGLVNLPTSVKFLDYSSVSIFRRNSFDKLPSYIAVTSQEESQVFIGIIEEIPQAPYFKISTLPKNTIYNTPRLLYPNDECLIQYCNIEGVTWRAKNQLILVSDKSKPVQSTACIETDQSIHYFTFPEHLTD